MLLAYLFAASGANAKVAHFNHGLRPDSDEDERLVQNFANQHNLEFVSERATLPSDSEDTARRARHQFFAEQCRVNCPRDSLSSAGAECPTERGETLGARGAAKAPAVLRGKKLVRVIATAHHLDDLVETIAINLSRGTGWRGLAVLNRDHYIRPLLELEKSEIKSLARDLGIKWREDSTNQSTKYLRNRLRQKTAALPFDTKRQLLQLRNRQVAISNEIEEVLRRLFSVAEACEGDCARLAPKGISEGGSLRAKRNFPMAMGEVDAAPEGLISRRLLYKRLDDPLALELLRHLLLQNGIKTTRPELSRLLQAIRTYKPQKRFQLTNNRFILIRRHDLQVL